jgi:inorganic pyrophosphatase
VTAGGAVPRPGRLIVRCIVEQPAGPGNRYAVDRSSGMVTLDGIEPDLARCPIERGHLLGTAAADGSPLPVLVAVRLPTFAGCCIPVYPIGIAELGGATGAVIIAVPAVDPMLAAAGAVEDLPETARRAILAATGGAAVRDAAAAEAAVRAAIESGRRLRADHEQDHRQVIAWKVSDWRAPAPAGIGPSDRGPETVPYSFAELAVPRLPSRFQTYIARALLPEERIILFVRRPALRIRRGLGLRRTSLHEGILVVTDRQVLFMQDSLPPSSTLGHWGYIARVSAIERLAAVAVGHADGLVTLSLTFAAERGAEAVTIPFSDDLSAAVDEAASFLRAFIPTSDTRALRRVYRCDAPGSLPNFAELLGRERAPDWTSELLPEEPVFAWAQSRTDHGRAVRLVVGPHHVATETGAGGTSGAIRCPIDQITSLELTLSILGSRMEVARGDGASVQRTMLRFDYPAAPAFSGAFTVIRHLMGRAPEQH